jgi:hypothetical protein
MGRGVQPKGRRRFALALTLVAALMVPGLAQAKKAKRLNVTQTVNAPIPNGTPAAQGELRLTINAGKKFKGLKVRDVNVTVQTTGSGANAAGDISGRLIAPNGAGVLLFPGLPSQNVGPLTLDDEASLTLGGTSSPNLFLGPPFAGSALPGSSILGKPLWVMDDGRVRGNWVLSILEIGNPTTNVLNSWTLDVKTGKPFETEE